MLEIKPLSPTHPVIKPVKINNDEHHPNQQPPKKQPIPEEVQDPTQPVQHIDEIV